VPQLKALKVSARDAQTILGHTRIGTTLKIYTDTDEAARCTSCAEGLIFLAPAVVLGRRDHAQYIFKRRSRQVATHVEALKPQVCKIVGSACVGSNPTPATTCCYHLRRRPASWEFSAMRAVSDLPRRVSPRRAIDRHVALSTDT
jgi:hypothetical protein